MIQLLRVCPLISNVSDSEIQEKGIETHEKTQPNGKTKQVFFFDPDGELLSSMKFTYWLASGNLHVHIIFLILHFCTCFLRTRLWIIIIDKHV